MSLLTWNYGYYKPPIAFKGRVFSSAGEVIFELFPEPSPEYLKEVSDANKLDFVRMQIAGYTPATANRCTPSFESCLSYRLFHTPFIKMEDTLVFGLKQDNVREDWEEAAEYSLFE